MNSKIAMSGLSILASLAIMGGATFAFFSDQGASNDNLFSTGSLTLALTDSNETDQNTVSASFGDTNMAPGDCSGPQTLSLENIGTVAGNHADVTGVNSNAVLAALLRIDSATYDAVNILPKIADSQANGFIDLADLQADPNDGFENLGLTDLLTPHPLIMEVCLDESATSAVEGMTNDLDLTVELRQQAHGSE